jgi:hypothetical protein
MKEEQKKEGVQKGQLETDRQNILNRKDESSVIDSGIWFLKHSRMLQIMELDVGQPVLQTTLPAALCHYTVSVSQYVTHRAVTGKTSV